MKSDPNCLYLTFSLFSDRCKINLNEISHDSAIGLVTRVLNMGVLLTEVCMHDEFSLKA